MHQDFFVTPKGSTPVTATLADTSSTQMSIELSQPYAPAGKVSFLITNAGTMDHEMVVLKTDQPAGSFDTIDGVRRGARTGSTKTPRASRTWARPGIRR